MFTQHPQGLLPPNEHIRRLLVDLLDYTRYDPDDGFVGFGVNLVHLTPQLLQLQVNLQARLGKYSGCACAKRTPLRAVQQAQHVFPSPHQLP
jgi:hypothetical protein